MRKITKGTSSHRALALANGSPPTTANEATTRWANFYDKAGVLSELIDEQLALCCYSEVRPDRLKVEQTQTSIGFHIEHVLNKSANPHLTFDFNNLAASAFSSASLAYVNKNDVFGGHAGGKQTGQTGPNLIDCHNENGMDFFTFVRRGYIHPRATLSASDNARAVQTIQALNLNASLLVARRRAWWFELEELLNEHLEKNWSIDDLIASILLPINTIDRGPELEEFFSLSRQFFGQRGIRILKSRAPYLLP